MQPVPKVIVFDLDGTLWNPEMYQLSGGSPFTIPRNNNTNKKGKQNDHETNNNNKKEEEPSYDALLDRSGTAVRLIGETRQVLTTLLNDPRYAETYVAVSSTCDEPHWAAELLEKFKLEKINHNNQNKKEWVPMGSLFTDLKEVYYASKADQHRTILKK
ncbi:hypothetical protein AGDE_10528 [Angomonas deanei]|uniref:Acid Phosphatase, putative n=1 Tax=Angomonas deanei TaxID=59799 RepID=A0A7G2C730_9TRYP|nr:hypothetical protein AGDE_10528 [Angomonas deanei]CAD2215620.1 Acid Phosphatase, putative [Angomonas deanei]|eukprot:EPY28145.1 hypothetical protein AGDE_10528 [Angomonas deanei]